MKYSKEWVRGQSRRDFIRTAGGAILTLPMLGTQAMSQTGKAGARGKRPKNILFLMTDQQHIDALSAAGCPHVHTPAMDSLAKSGMSFEASYCPFPVCVPSRAATFSGRAASEALTNRRIAPEIPNLGQWFSENANYDTVYSGKWHLPRTYTQFIDGFHVPATGLLGMGYICDPVTSRSCEAYIRNTPESKSFLMVASFMQPHDICEWLRLNTRDPGKLRYPQLADSLPPLPENFHYDANEPDWVRNYRRRNDPFEGRWPDRDGNSGGNWSEEQWRYYMWSYYRHVEQVDAEIGRILQALEDTGRLQNTLIVFTSDHGEGLAHHQMVRKGTTYDESAKVPLIFAWPGHIPANSIERDTPVSGIDIMATLCDYAGIKSPSNLRGVSLRPLLEKSATLDRECIVAENAGNLGRAVRSRDYKYIVYMNDPVEQLFDCRNDPAEIENLAGDSQYAGVIDEHRKFLRQWESRLDVQPDARHQDAWWRAFH